MYIYTVVHYNFIFIICIYIFLYFFLFIHIRGSQKLIKLKKYNLQNRNYNRFSLQLQRYCVTYEFLIPFKNASNIIFFFLYMLYLCILLFIDIKSSGHPSRENHAIDFRIIFPFIFSSYSILSRDFYDTVRVSKNYWLSVISFISFLTTFSLKTDLLYSSKYNVTENWYKEVFYLVVSLSYFFSL